MATVAGMVVGIPLVGMAAVWAAHRMTDRLAASVPLVRERLRRTGELS